MNQVVDMLDDASPNEGEKESLDKKDGSLEQQLLDTLSLMENALSQGKKADFKVFWDAGKKCLALFKSDIPASFKAAQWSRYRDLTKEARRLKEIVEEQSAFAVEQIEIAISALEKEIAAFPEHVEKIESLSLPTPLSLKEVISGYGEKQKVLNLLNTYAARINALRKELMKTEMRIKKKNQLFQRLSVAGDHIFPQRKELIKEISQQFVEDVSRFVKQRFHSALQERHLYAAREEIKSLQLLAKELTLNTSAFTQTRADLSQCWERLKVADKERKKEQAEKKLAAKESLAALEEKLKDFEEICLANQLSFTEIQKKFEEVRHAIRQHAIDREEAKRLHQRLYDLLQPVKQRQVEEERAKKQLEQAKEGERLLKIQEVEERAKRLLATHDQAASEEILAAKEGIASDMEKLALSEGERSSILRQLEDLDEAVLYKEIALALELPQGHHDKSAKLHDVYQSAQARKEATKDLLEKYRKVLGGSGLDIEQSLLINELLEDHKLRMQHLSSLLEKLEAAMREAST